MLMLIKLIWSDLLYKDVNWVSMKCILTSVWSKAPNDDFYENMDFIWIGISCDWVIWSIAKLQREFYFYLRGCGNFLNILIMDFKVCLKGCVYVNCFGVGS